MKKLFLFAFSGIWLAATGCQKNEAMPDNNITSIVSNDPNFSLLLSALVKADLVTTINTSNNITVFAPDNAAFAAAGIDAAAISSLSKDALAGILKYHVLGSVVSSANVPANGAVPTLENKNLFASRNASGVFVNGIKVKVADLQASNGVIHVIEKVMMPPTQTIAQIAAATPSLSLLLTAVVKAGLANAVSGDGNFTVFAPTNAAFNAAGFNSDADINAASTSLISTVVRYHVLTTNVFASDLINNTNATTLQGGALLINITSAASVKIAASSNPSSNITSADIVATNGVVHLINRVLLP